MPDLNDSRSLDQSVNANDSEDIFKQYSQPALIAALLILAALIAVVYWWHQKTTREAAAMGKFNAAKAVEEYQAVLSLYPGTPAEALSLIQLAKAADEKQDFAVAVKSWDRFLKTFPRHPAIPAVQYARAVSLQGAGSMADAKAAYEVIFNSRPPHAFAGASAVALARIYQAEKNTTAARQVLTDLLARDNSSSRLGEARELLRELPEGR